MSLFVLVTIQIWTLWNTDPDISQECFLFNVYLFMCKNCSAFQQLISVNKGAALLVKLKKNCELSVIIQL